MGKTHRGSASPGTVKQVPKARAKGKASPKPKAKASADESSRPSTVLHAAARKAQGDDITCEICTTTPQDTVSLILTSRRLVFVVCACMCFSFLRMSPRRQHIARARQDSKWALHKKVSIAGNAEELQPAGPFCEECFCIGNEVLGYAPQAMEKFATDYSDSASVKSKVEQARESRRSGKLASGQSSASSGVAKCFSQRVRVLDTFAAFTEDELRKLLNKYRVPRLALRKVQSLEIPSRANPALLETVYLFKQEDLPERRGGRDIILESEFELSKSVQVLAPDAQAYKNHSTDVFQRHCAAHFANLEHLVGVELGPISKFVSEHASSRCISDVADASGDDDEPSAFVGVAATAASATGDVAVDAPLFATSVETPKSKRPRASSPGSRRGGATPAQSRPAMSTRGNSVTDFGDDLDADTDVMEVHAGVASTHSCVTCPTGAMACPRCEDSDRAATNFLCVSSSTRLGVRQMGGEF